MNRLRIITVVAAIAFFAVGAMADESWRYSVVGENSSNPAEKSRIDFYNSTSVTVGFNHELEKEAVVIEEGRGHNLADITVVTRQHLKNGEVWGGASFTTGSLRDIRFNSASDYRNVAPYVVADSVGGSRSVQQYSFLGGYSAEAGERLTWGAEMAYRAGIEYRNRDPRVKNIVSDFRLLAGLTASLSDKAYLGASAGLHLYNQDSDVEFYNPMNSIHEFVATGVGTTFARFYGSTSSSAYKGLGLVSNLQFVAGNGMRLAAGFDYDDMDFILRDYNDLTLANIDNYKVSGEIAYSIGNIGVITEFADNAKIKPHLNVDWNRRIGRENIFGTATGNSYPVIGDRQYYWRDLFDADLTVEMKFPLRTYRKYGILLVAPEVIYAFSDEHYRQPVRHFKADWLTFGTKLGFEQVTFPSLLKYGVNAGVFYTAANDKESVFEGFDVEKMYHQAVLHNFEMLSSDRLALSADMFIDVPISKTTVSGKDGHGVVSHTTVNYSLFFSASFEHYAYNHHGAINQVSIRAGLKF